MVTRSSNEALIFRLELRFIQWEFVRLVAFSPASYSLKSLSD